MSIDNSVNRNDEGSLSLGPSATLKQAGSEQPRDRHRATWRAENAIAIQAYNERIDQHGTFSDSVRKF